jgi:hypothetical protein
VKKKKEKMSFTDSVKTPKRGRGGSYIESYYRNGSSPWFPEIKINRHAFVSLNRMRVGHYNLIAGVSRFNILSTAECERGD